MVAHVGHVEEGSIEKTTGLPDAPPVADSVITWPSCSVVGGLKPVMVCGMIDDTVAVPLRLTLNVAAGVATAIVAVPDCGPFAVAGGGAKVPVNWQAIPGFPDEPLVQAVGRSRNESEHGVRRLSDVRSRQSCRHVSVALEVDSSRNS